MSSSNKKYRPDKELDDLFEDSREISDKSLGSIRFTENKQSDSAADEMKKNRIKDDLLELCDPFFSKLQAYLKTKIKHNSSQFTSYRPEGEFALGIESKIKIRVKNTATEMARTSDDEKPIKEKFLEKDILPILKNALKSAEENAVTAAEKKQDYFDSDFALRDLLTREINSISPKQNVAVIKSPSSRT